MIRTSPRPNRAQLAALLAALLALVLLPATPSLAADGDITIDDVAVTEGNPPGTTTLTFTLTAEGAFASSGGTVEYVTTDGSAIAGEDYEFAQGTATFGTVPALPDDAVEATVDITILRDTDSEPTETFGLSLFNPSGGLQITDFVGVGTIMNDDGGFGTPGFAILDGQVNEDQGPGLATLTLNPPSDEEETVQVTFSDGTATQVSGDYGPVIPNPRTVTMPANTTSVTFPVPVNDDDTFEGDETILLSLGNASGGTAISRSEATFTIVEDEVVPRLSINDDSADEDATNDSGLFEFLVTSDQESNEPITVTWTLMDGTGDNPATRADGDFPRGEDDPVTGTVSIPAGDTEASTEITFRAGRDANVEADETFRVVLSNIDGTATFEDNVGIATIPNNDNGDRTVSILDAVSVQEGDAADQQVFLEFPVRLNGYAAKHTADDNTITVDWRTQNATAVSGQDYVAASGTVTIPEGDIFSTEPIRVQVIGDLASEADEVVITLVDSSTGPSVFSPGEGGQGTILNDDPNLSIQDAALSEGDNPDADKRLSTRVTLSSAVDYDVVVDYDTEDGTATAGEDYTARPDGARAEGNGTLTIPAGDLFGIVDVRISGDAEVEGDETFTVTLSNPRTYEAGADQSEEDPSEDDVFLTDDEATLTIRDDDTEGPGDNGPLSLNAGGDRDLDTAEAATFTAQLANVDGTASVTWDFGDGTTATGAEVTKVYDEVGEYVVQVKASDDNDTDNDLLRVTVTDEAVAVRAAGEDRVLTAVAAAREGWDQADTVLLGTSLNFPDALAAGPYAAVEDAPLLLTPPDAVPGAVLDLLAELDATTVVLLGGENAVPASIATELSNAGLVVERIDGDDRFATAAKLAREVGAPDDVAVIANGRSFPDALGAGSFNALDNPLPVLLSETDDVPDVTMDTLVALGVDEVLVLGGPVALSATAEAELVAAGYDVTRLAGETRYDTSVAVAADALRRFGDRQAFPVFVTGENFPDGLAAGALAARVGGPVVLVPRESLPDGTAQFLQDNADQLDDPFFLGGEVAITEVNKVRITRELDKSTPD